MCTLSTQLHTQHSYLISHITSLSLSLSLSLFVGGHFPGESGLAGFIEAKDDGSGGDNWSWYRAKLQSHRHHQQTTTQLFTRWMPFLSHKALKGRNYHTYCPN